MLIILFEAMGFHDLFDKVQNHELIGVVTWRSLNFRLQRQPRIATILIFYHLNIRFETYFHYIFFLSRLAYSLLRFHYYCGASDSC